MDRAISLSITDCTNKSFIFKTLRELHDFACNERNFWSDRFNDSKDARGMLQQYLDSNRAFASIVSEIEAWQEKLASWTDEQFARQIEHLKRSFLPQPNRYLWSGHSFIDALIDCQIHHGNSASDAFADLLINNRISNSLSNAEQLYGALAAYEFKFQSSDIVKRRISESSSLDLLRNRLEETNRKLFGEVELAKSEISEWSKHAKEKSDQIRRIITKQGKKTLNRQDRSYQESLRDWSTSIEDLERTYEEKLKLSKPAEYWSKAADKYGRQGTLWSLSIIALVVVGLIYFRDFFLTWLSGTPVELGLNSLQGIILFGSIIGIYAYLMRILSRLAFSAFHLMRDAEEREQLTYLYLSLTNESAVDEKSREIVLQALFSRTETGLIQQESGPTMPGAVDAARLMSRLGPRS